MKKKFPIKNYLIYLILAIVLINTLTIARLTSSISNAMAEALELSRPAKLSAVIIKPDSCENCFDIESAYEGIKNANILIEDEKRLTEKDDEAGQLIAKYGIEKLPTIIFTGEIQKDPELEKAWDNIGEIRNEAVIFTKLTPPYFSTAENRVVGEVKVTYIEDSSCDKCFTYKSFVNQLKNSGVSIKNEKTVNYNETEGRKLIQEYGITTVPTFVLDKEIGVYENVTKDWSRFGKVADDGNYITTQVNPPYRDIKSGTIKGLIALTNLVDPSCSECFPVSSLKQIINRFGPVYGSERTVSIDSLEGKALIDKYQITKVPTIILDDQAGFYAALNQVWNQVGTLESDKTYIVRNLSVVRGGKYKDLTTDTIISN